MSLSPDQCGLCYPLGVIELPVRPGGREAPHDRSGPKSISSQRTIRSISASDLLELDVPPPEMLIEGLWQVEGCGYLAGEPKCLKTYTIMDMAIAINMGGLVFGRYPVLHPGPVLIVLEETKPSEAKQRLEWLMRGCGIEKSVDDLHFAIQQGVRLDREECWDEIRALCERYAPVMTFFDPLSRMHEGQENKQECMSPILRQLRRLQVDFHTAVAITHHLSKPGAEGSANVRMGHRIRGTSDQHSWLDCAMYFTKKRNDRRIRVEVEHRESGEPEPFSIELEVYETSEGTTAQLRHVPEGNPRSKLPEIRSRIEEQIRDAAQGINTTQLFARVRGRKESVQAVLTEMNTEGAIVQRSESRPDASGKPRRCKVIYASALAPVIEEGR
jgi:hypothetical protein